MTTTTTTTTTAPTRHACIVYDVDRCKTSQTKTGCQMTQSHCKRNNHVQTLRLDFLLPMIERREAEKREREREWTNMDKRETVSTASRPGQDVGQRLRLSPPQYVFVCPRLQASSELPHHTAKFSATIYSAKICPFRWLSFWCVS